MTSLSLAPLPADPLAPDLNVLSAIGHALADRYPALDLGERLAAACEAIPGRLVFTTSFGLEDQAIGHAILAQDLPIDLVTFDTGRLFPETHDVWAATEARYGRRIRALFPERHAVEAWAGRHGINGFRASVEARKACCAIRKIEPLRRALADASGWVTGIRAEQSPERAMMAFAAIDSEHRLLKLNPLLDWTRDRVLAFVREHHVPYNALHDRGFLSIGCAPCTRALAPGEPERAGRWWWEETGPQKECGLHRPAGALLAAQT
jgi:phosphoadenosine phosphosulfate reductase